MQSIVDTIYPEHAKREAIIVKKIKELYPTINLEDLLDDYKFEQCKIKFPSKLFENIIIY